MPHVPLPWRRDPAEGRDALVVGGRPSSTLVCYLSTPWPVTFLSVSRVVELLLAVVTSGLASTLITQFLGRRKLRAEGEKITAEAVEILTRAAKTVVEQLEGEVSRLTDEVDRLRGEVSTARGEVVVLRGILRDHGIDPYPPMPPVT